MRGRNHRHKIKNQGLRHFFGAHLDQKQDLVGAGLLPPLNS
jgi:hypothetical protein